MRRIEKDNDVTSVEWDLKNNVRILIASGMYIIHVKADGIGEKTLKWFRVIRPVVLTAIKKRGSEVFWTFLLICKIRVQ